MRTTETTAASSPVYGTYVVKKGDTLEKIAIRQHTTVGELTKLNKIKRNDHIYIGRKLKVPPESPEDEEISVPVLATYTVKKGDTLDKIAQKHHMSVAAILILNDMKPQDSLYVNRKLKVYAVSRDNGKVEASASTKRGLAVYTVRKGDCVDKIASKASHDCFRISKSQWHEAAGTPHRESEGQSVLGRKRPG